MDYFIGTIRLFAFDYAPPGWVLCDGRMLSPSQNAALFSLLGIKFGGNGQTTFGIPDLRFGRNCSHLHQERTAGNR